MDAQELKRLKELAKKATPGPWRASFPTANDIPIREADCQVSVKGSLIANVSHGPIYPSEPFGSAQREANATFIAAANPAAILELIAQAERAVSPAESVKARQAPDLSRMVGYSPAYVGGSVTMMFDPRGRYWLAKDVKALLAQPLQQEGGKDEYPEPLRNFQEGQWWVEKLDEAAKKTADLDLKRAVAVVHHMLRSAPHPSDNLQQASTAQAEPAKKESK